MRPRPRTLLMLARDLDPVHLIGALVTFGRIATHNDGTRAQSGREAEQDIPLAMRNARFAPLRALHLHEHRKQNRMQRDNIRDSA